MKDVPWFKHDANATDDPKIEALIHLHGMEGYGRWWTIVEFLRLQDGYIMVLTKWTFRAFAKKWGCTPGEAEQFIRELAGEEIELLEMNKETAWSSRVLRDMDIMAMSKQRYADAGRKGGKAAASLKQRLSDAKPTPRHRSSNEKRKEKKEGGIRIPGIPDGAAAPEESPPSASPSETETGIMNRLSAIHLEVTGKPLPELSERILSQLENLQVSEDPVEIESAYRTCQKAHSGKAMNLFLADYFEWLQKAKKSTRPPREEVETVECPDCHGKKRVSSRGEAHCNACRLIWSRKKVEETGDGWEPAASEPVERAPPGSADTRDKAAI